MKIAKHSSKLANPWLNDATTARGGTPQELTS